MEFTPGKPVPLHPRYRDQVQERSFWRRSRDARHNYAGGTDAGGNPILPKHEREIDRRYARRINQAIVRPFVRAICTRYNDFACREAPSRPDAAGEYGKLTEDATGTGVPLDDLMRRALMAAQVDGAAYLLADSSDDASYASAAAESIAGRRGILQLIDADQVLHWTDWRGQMVAAVVSMVGRDGRPYLWRVTESYCQRIEVADNDSEDPARWQVATLGPELPHNAGGCPLVRLRPIDGAGSQAEPIAESQKRICGLDSLLLEELAGVTFTATVFLGVNGKDVPADAFATPGGVICIPSNGGTLPQIGKISADTAQAESLRKSLDRELAELYRVAGLAAGNPTQAGQPESGVSKAFAFNEVEATLSGLADAAEGAENLAIERLSAMHGWPFPGRASWPDSFDTADLAADLESMIRMSTAGAPAVLVDQSWRDFASIHFQLTPAQKKQLDEQLKASADMEANGPSAQLDALTIPGRKAGA